MKEQAFLPGMEEIAAAHRRKAMLRAWWLALRIAAKRGGSFAMAYAIFDRQFGEMPPKEFPCQPKDHYMTVAEAYPKLAPKRKKQ